MYTAMPHEPVAPADQRASRGGSPTALSARVAARNAHGSPISSQEREITQHGLLAPSGQVGAVPARRSEGSLPLDARLARCVAQRAASPAEAALDRLPKPLRPAPGGILQRTEDDAIAYAVGAGIQFPTQPSADDLIALLVALARAGDPRFTPLKYALLHNAPADAAGRLEEILQVRLAWVMTPQQRREALDDDLPENDEADLDYESDFTVPKRRAGARPKPLPQTLSTMDTFKPKGSKAAGQRVKGAGAITGTMETVQHVGGAIQRPTNISGFVDPQATSGRPNAPEPSSGIRVGVQAKLVDQKVTRNSGIIDAQKGHIMALELGGPDKPWNIVPQWGNWQGNGVWRKAEVAILKLAQVAAARGNRLKFDAQVLYKLYAKPSQGTLKGLTFPTRFIVMVQEFDKHGDPIGTPQAMFDDQQHRDHTDDMIADRVFDALDAQDDTAPDISDSDMGSESDDDSA